MYGAFALLDHGSFSLGSRGQSCVQPSGLKLGTKGGCGEIFQKPLWLTSLTFSFGVSGGGGGRGGVADFAL